MDTAGSVAVSFYLVCKGDIVASVLAGADVKYFGVFVEKLKFHFNNSFIYYFTLISP